MLGLLQGSNGGAGNAGIAEKQEQGMLGLLQGFNGGAGNAGIAPTIDPMTQRITQKCGNCSPTDTTPSQEGHQVPRRAIPILHRIPWNPGADPSPTLTTRMYPSGGTWLISFFRCSTARTRSMTFPYTGSSVRSRLAVGAGWMDCQGILG